MSRLPLGCGDRSGFLFAHACDRPATGQCARCGRPICLEHTRMTEAGATCVTCLRADQDDGDAADSGHDTSSSSTSTSGAAAAASDPAFAGGGGAFGGAGAREDWASDPHFYGQAADAYDADDYAAFDPSAVAAANDTEDADDGFESDTGAS